MCCSDVASRPIFMILALASGRMALASKVQALASKVQALALRAALTNFCHHRRTHGPTTTTKIKLKIIVNNNWHVIINKWISKHKQSELSYYLCCQAVRRTAYLNFCGSRMLKGLGLGTTSLALASKVQALALRDEALALRFWPWLHHWCVAYGSSHDIFPLIDETLKRRLQSTSGAFCHILPTNSPHVNMLLRLILMRSVSEK